ncbi:MAG: hypothetical protein KAH20_00835 [Methylococcales bacterium]|nr:hypothetical protein [Methylococcales bacterium]
MKRKLGAIVCLLSFMFVSTSQAEDCSLTYTMKGWAAFYKTYKGTGTVTCPSGKSANVALSFTGGGFTFGSYEIVDGKGTLRGIESIDDIFGGAFSLDGDAGFGKSIEGRLVLRGARGVSLSGKGTGYHLGWAMGSFKITRP